MGDYEVKVTEMNRTDYFLTFTEALGRNGHWTFLMGGGDEKKSKREKKQKKKKILESFFLYLWLVSTTVLY